MLRISLSRAVRRVLNGLVLATLFLSSSAPGAAAPYLVPALGGAPSLSSAVGVVRGEARGVQISLHLAPGPYFLSELLPVQIELRNHTRHSLFLDGDPTPDFGIPVLGVRDQGGSAPTYVLPFINTFPAGPARTFNLPAGQRVMLALLVPLTASGQLTIAAQAHFTPVSHRERAGVYSAVSTDPFKGRQPTLLIAVSSHIPVNRVIHLRQSHGDHSSTASVGGAHQPAFVYQDRLACGGSTLVELAGTRYWTPLPGGGVARPSCSDVPSEWDIMVGAPGYAISAQSDHQR